MRAVAAVPRLDIVVHAAGGNIPEPFLDVTEEHLDRLLTLNVKAAFLVAQAAVSRMDAGGVIVFIGSQMGHVGASGRTVYCATKHAVEGLTKALAVELAPRRIRVVGVAPTFVETSMTASYLSGAFRNEALGKIPLGRFGDVADVSAAVAFLSSPQASMITGCSLLVDGGWTAQ
jgi:NAD(P)-dependent dehydrogenase (short-subunit alcohol dehydrogenase family)